MKKLFLSLIGSVCAVLLLASCQAPNSAGGSAQNSTDGSAQNSAGDNPQKSTESESLTIFAAASLQDAFQEAATTFKDSFYPELQIDLQFEGSNTLATWVTEGADADVIATANEKSMVDLTSAGLIGEAQVFASNHPVLIVNTENRAEITSIEDLASGEGSKGVKTMICQPAVPCGKAADRLFELKGVNVQPVSLEQNVTAVLQKVELGEADAGIVYFSDLKRNSGVEEVRVTGVEEITSRYPIALIERSKNKPLAAEFIDFITSETGQQIMIEYGFKRG